MLDDVGQCLTSVKNVECSWVLLDDIEWFGHSTQQSHVGTSAMAEARHILSSFAWVEGSFGCDLRKVETKHQNQGWRQRRASGGYSPLVGAC